MPKNLIVITKLFPYNFTEAFLESETPFLQEKFKNIIFMPLLKGSIRPNFSSLSVDDSYNILYAKKARMFIRTLLSFNLYKSLFFHRRTLFKKKMLIACIKQQIHVQIIKRIIKNNPSNFTEDTIVYSYWFNAPVYAFLKIRKKYRMKYRVVCRAHRWDVYDEDGDMPYRRYCIEHIDKIFPISQDACDFLTKKYGYKDKYILSRLGVQKQNVTTKESPPFNFQVLTVSQLIQRKRVDLVLSALTEFASKNKDVNVRWTHFGTGDMEKDLKMKASSIDIPNMRTTFMGYVPNVEIMQFMEESKVDVFINLSTSEGVPVSIMEAQSYGIPVIATNVGGTGEIIDKDNGILLSPCPTLEDVVSALEKVYQSDFNRDIIKNHWNKLSNAQINFKHFVDILSNIQ